MAHPVAVLNVALLQFSGGGRPRAKTGHSDRGCQTARFAPFAVVDCGSTLEGFSAGLHPSFSSRPRTSNLTAEPGKSTRTRRAYRLDVEQLMRTAASRTSAAEIVPGWPCGGHGLGAA